MERNIYGEPVPNWIGNDSWVSRISTEWLIDAGATFYKEVEPEVFEVTTGRDTWRKTARGWTFSCVGSDVTSLVKDTKFFGVAYIELLDHILEQDREIARLKEKQK